MKQIKEEFKAESNSEMNAKGKLALIEIVTEIYWSGRNNRLDTLYKAVIKSGVITKETFEEWVKSVKKFDDTIKDVEFVSNEAEDLLINIEMNRIIDNFLELNPNIIYSMYEVEKNEL